MVCHGSTRVPRNPSLLTPHSTVKLSKLRRSHASVLYSLTPNDADRCGALHGLLIRRFDTVRTNHIQDIQSPLAGSTCHYDMVTTPWRFYGLSKFQTNNFKKPEQLHNQHVLQPRIHLSDPHTSSKYPPQIRTFVSRTPRPRLHVRHVRQLHSSPDKAKCDRTLTRNGLWLANQIRFPEWPSQEASWT